MTTLKHQQDMKNIDYSLFQNKFYNLLRILYNNLEIEVENQ
jgi:hypothetical protein